MPYNYAAARAAGLTDQDIQTYLASKGQPQPQKGGGITDWLPAIGAIGGSFLGGPLLGGALGAGAGTLLKQEITGQGDIGELGREVALGGVGGVVGKGIGKVAGRFLPKAGTQIAAKAGMGVTQKLAAKTIASNFTIPPKIAPQLQIEDALGQMIQDGIKIPNSIKGYQKVANLITGDSGAITQAQRLATKQLKIPINFDQALTDAKGFVGLKGSLSADERLDVLATIRNYFNNRAYPAPGHIGADDALDIANQLDKEGYNLLHKGINELSPNAALEAKGEAFIGVAEDLRNQISRGIDSTGIFSKVQANAIAELEKISPQLAQRARTATNMSQLRSVASPYVRINRAAQSTLNRQQTPFVGGGLQLGTRGAGALTGGALAGLPGAAMGAAFAPAAAGVAQAAQPTITGLASKGILGAGKLAGKAGALGGLGPLAAQTAGQVGVRGGIPQPQGIEELPFELPQEPVRIGQDQQLRGAFAQAILANPKQASAIKAAYDLFSGGAKGAAGTAADRVASLKVGEIAVDQALKSTTKGYGPVGGGISQTLLKKAGGIGVPSEVVSTNTRYQLLRQSVVRALQGARMSDVDIRLALEYIPQITDTQNTATEKLKVLKSFLAETKQFLQNAPQQESSIPLPENLGL